jgi:hypothetical protein
MRPPPTRRQIGMPIGRIGSRRDRRGRREVRRAEKPGISRIYQDLKQTILRISTASALSAALRDLCANPKMLICDCFVSWEPSFGRALHPISRTAFATSSSRETAIRA